MDLDVEQLMARIRDSAARRNRESDTAGLTLLQLLERSNKDFDLPEIKLAPEFKRRANDHYHVNELLQFQDRDFVRNAYRAILKREPDEAGLNCHLEWLRSGRRNKIDILGILSSSAEGRERGVRVDGLRFPAFVRGFSRLPIIGYAYELVVGLIRLPVSVYHNRQFQAYVIAQQQQIADHVNRVTRTVRGLEPFVDEVRSAHGDLAIQRDRLSALQQVSEKHAQQFAEHEAALRELAHEDERLEAQDERLMAQDEVLKSEAEALKSQIATQDGLLQRTNELQANHSQTLAEVLRGLHEQRLELSAQHARLMAGLRTAERTSLSGVDGGEDVQDSSLDPLLLLLEDRFRGERAELKERLSFYLPYLEQENITDNILDVGCGRGEWLELLKDTGRTAHGVDSNRLMVETSQDAGLEAVHADVFDYFSGVTDKSLNAVSAFHVIEHLEFARLVEFIDQCIRVLRPGGLLILETPNPENAIVATRTFYLDPTHVRPLPRELIQFVLEARGLVKVEIVGLHPLTEARVAGDTELANRVNDLFYGPMDYGIIARRS